MSLHFNDWMTIYGHLLYTQREACSNGHKGEYTWTIDWIPRN